MKTTIEHIKESHPKCGFIDEAEFFRAIIHKSGMYYTTIGKFEGTAHDYAIQVAEDYMFPYGNDEEARQFPGGFETYEKFIKFAEKHFIGM